MMVPRLLLATCLSAGLAIPALGADRVRAGQWEVTLQMAGRSMTQPTCLTQADADAINGDAKSVRQYAERVSAQTGCKVNDVKVNGNQVTVTSVCASGKENVGTTTYHGDSYEAVNTNGTRSQAKRVGACK
jgi:hypothetical protein